MPVEKVQVGLLSHGRRIRQPFDVAGAWRCKVGPKPYAAGDLLCSAPISPLRGQSR